MKQKLALSLAAMLLPLSAAAAAEPAEPPRTLGEEASIVFPSDSSIRNWRGDDGRGIWVQDRRGDWYYGRFAGYCPDLDFASAFGIDAPGAGRLDRFATIVVRGQRCPLTSFVTATPPSSEKDKEEQ